MTGVYPRFTFPGEQIFEVPKRFWEDHAARGLICTEKCPHQMSHENDESRVIETSRHYRVTLTAIDVTELASDAAHYSDVVGWAEDSYYLGLQSSARATLKRLEGHARNPGMTKEVTT